MPKQKCEKCGKVVAFSKLDKFSKQFMKTERDRLLIALKATGFINVNDVFVTFSYNFGTAYHLMAKSHSANIKEGQIQLCSAFKHGSSNIYSKHKQKAIPANIMAIAKQAQKINKEIDELYDKQAKLRKELQNITAYERQVRAHISKEILKRTSMGQTLLSAADATKLLTTPMPLA